MAWGTMESQEPLEAAARGRRPEQHTSTELQWEGGDNGGVRESHQGVRRTLPAIGRLEGAMSQGIQSLWNQGPQFCNFVELHFANNLKERGSGCIPRAPRKEHGLANTLISPS